MMNETSKMFKTLKVDAYDGQCISVNNEEYLELGGYLGGGVAGVVYEAVYIKKKESVAVKILNPVGYKLTPNSLISRCIVAMKGDPLDQEIVNRIKPMEERHVWWLYQPSSKQVIPAFEDPISGCLRELPLPQSIQVWSLERAANISDEEIEESYKEVTVQNITIKIPEIPAKFIKFAKNRGSMCREISNMLSLGKHDNVLRLEEALELIQDSKCTIFLILELASGGELFDRIKLDCGTDEETARMYFTQLVSGVAFCHKSGICHRDDEGTLKIADFGLSAIISITNEENSQGASANASVSSMRRLRSIVGSPHYVAPEVLQDTGQGYDGTKADAWSLGIILYAMLAGNLPFGKDLLSCLRFDKFRKWSYQNKYHDDLSMDNPADEVHFPTWLFPSHFSTNVNSILAQLLYPDPVMRLSVEEAEKHAWVVHGPSGKITNSTSEGSSMDFHCPSLKYVASPLKPTSYRNSNSGGSNYPFSVSTSSTTMFSIQRSPAKMIPSGFMPVVLEETMAASPPATSTSYLSTGHCSGSGSSHDQTVLRSPPPRYGSLKQTPASPNHSDTSTEEAYGDEERGSLPLTITSSTSLSSSPSSVCLPLESMQPSFMNVDVTCPTETSSMSQPSFASPAIVSRGQTKLSLYNSPPLVSLNGIEELDLFSLNTGFSHPPDLVKKGYQRRVSWGRGSKSPGGLFANLDSTRAAIVDGPPRSYHESVRRSTRFTTSVPANIVLNTIEAIVLQRSLSPPPAPSMLASVPLRVQMDWTNYRLDVYQGVNLTCTVQIFMLQQGIYMVEFLRGQLDIFVFKRFYEDVREEISQSIKNEPVTFESCHSNARIAPSFVTKLKNTQ